LRFKLANDSHFNEFVLKHFVDEEFDSDSFGIFKFFTPNFDHMLHILEDPIGVVK
jgi:hypothetical protein